MNIQNTIREAIVAELRRQAEAGEDSPLIDIRDDEFVVINGRIDLDALIMVVEGALAGGP